MVGLNGKVSNGAGNPAHKAGFDVEPMRPCITRQMTPEERKFYGVTETKKGAKKKMGKKKYGQRIDSTKLKEMVVQGYTAADIAEELDVNEKIIWERAKSYGLLTKRRENEEDVKEEAPALEEKTPKTEAVAEYPQDSEENEYRFLAPVWLDEIARGLTAGAVKHPGETWRGIPCGEHLARAMRHINLYRMGDRSEPHLVNASMRLMMAFETEGGSND